MELNELKVDFFSYRSCLISQVFEAYLTKLSERFFQIFIKTSQNESPGLIIINQRR